MSMTRSDRDPLSVALIFATYAMAFAGASTPVLLALILWRVW